MPVLQSSGLIGSSSGRPDGYFADAIYSSEVVDLRLSAYKDFSVNNTMQHLISGSARGVEGDWEVTEYFTTNQAVTPAFIGGSQTFMRLTELASKLLTDPEYFYPYITGKRIAFVQGNSGRFYKIQRAHIGSGDTYLDHSHGDVRADFTAGSNYKVVIADKAKSKSLNSASMLHCDIIGKVS